MSELRNRLVEIEPLSAERNEKLQREIQAMFEPKMSRWDKMYWGASAAGSLLFAVVAIPMVFVAPVSPVERKLWAIFGVLNAIVGVFLVWRVWKGSMHFGQQFAGSKWAPGVAMLIAVLLLINAVNNPTIENVAWELFGVMFLVLTLSIAVLNQVLSAELNSREQALKLEYRLAELAEKIGQ
jgi:hypothetical protein